MKEEELELLAQIDLLLDHLVANAEEMVEAAKLRSSSSEILTMQKKQEVLIGKLIAVDKKYEEQRKKLGIVLAKEMKSKIREKLHKFSKLNQVFIDRMAKSQRIFTFNRFTKSKRGKKGSSKNEQALK